MYVHLQNLTLRCQRRYLTPYEINAQGRKKRLGLEGVGRGGSAFEKLLLPRVGTVFIRNFFFVGGGGGVKFLYTTLSKTPRPPWIGPLYEKNNSSHQLPSSHACMVFHTNPCSKLFKPSFSLSLTHLRTQIACYELKEDLSLVMHKEIFHGRFENLRGFV